MYHLFQLTVLSLQLHLTTKPCVGLKAKRDCDCLLEIMGDPCVFFIKFPTEQKFCHVVLKIENQKITPQNQVNCYVFV